MCWYKRMPDRMLHGIKGGSAVHGNGRGKGDGIQVYEIMMQCAKWFTNMILDKVSKIKRSRIKKYWDNKGHNSGINKIFFYLLILSRSTLLALPIMLHKKFFISPFFPLPENNKKRFICKFLSILGRIFVKATSHRSTKPTKNTKTPHAPCTHNTRIPP